jgi:hypothetical protein
MASRRSPVIGLHRHHVPGPPVEARQVEAGAGAEVEDDLARPRGQLPHGLLDLAVRVGGAVLELIEVGVLLDVGRRVDAGQPLAGHRPGGKIQGS